MNYKKALKTKSALIKIRKANRKSLSKKNKLELEDIPFVVGYDLLEKEEKSLTTEEAVAVALALQAILPATESVLNATTNWQLISRAESVSNRI